VIDSENPRITLYALSTCVWCKMTRTFLDNNNVEYECIYVDQLGGDEKDRIMSELQERLGYRPSFPTVFCGESHVTGFKKDELKELLGI
jgi:glutaredoxin-like protein NrdH